jgi:hypothetical protein
MGVGRPAVARGWHGRESGHNGGGSDEGCGGGRDAEAAGDLVEAGFVAEMGELVAERFEVDVLPA